MNRGLVLVVIIAGCAHREAEVPLATTSSAQPQSLALCQFHSGAWINLHHVLWGEALRRSRPVGGGDDAVPDDVAATVLDLEETRIWSAAVDVYIARYAQRDFVFDDDMADISARLSAVDDQDVTRSGVPADLAAVLTQAMAIYRMHWWPAHDRSNRAWIAAVQSYIDRYGDELSRRLATVYRAGWPPHPFRVDVVHYASWAGAYTTLSPVHLTIASADARNQGPMPSTSPRWRRHGRRISKARRRSRPPFMIW
jgi:hypothetical protein